MRRQILRVQGAYYVTTGLWPLLSLPSFERLTGPKVDKWLVQMVGLLAASIGTTLLVGTRQREADDAIVALAVMSALSFSAIDVVHAARRRIPPIYLGDAIVEAAILAAIAFTT